MSLHDKLLKLSDKELIQRVRAQLAARKGKTRSGQRGSRPASVNDIAARTLFYADSEVATTAELQRRGMIDGDGQIRS